MVIDIVAHASFCLPNSYFFRLSSFLSSAYYETLSDLRDTRKGFDPNVLSRLKSSIGAPCRRSRLKVPYELLSKNAGCFLCSNVAFRWTIHVSVGYVPVTDVDDVDDGNEQAESSDSSRLVEEGTFHFSKRLGKSFDAAVRVTEDRPSGLLSPLYNE